MESLKGREMAEITEGSTRLLVPRDALFDAVPPRDVAFYNPKAGTSRDISVVAHAAFLDAFGGPKIILDPLCGVGSGGLRTANETRAVDRAYLNDANPNSARLAAASAALNGMQDSTRVSCEDACRFLARHAADDCRGAIVDVDPFGSPAPFLDCAARATMHGGMMSCTATDLQVLNGLFDRACENRYGGVPIRGTTYGSETAIRIVLGCMRMVASRLGLSIDPVFVSAYMHYYRMHVRIAVGHVPDMEVEMGYVVHCGACGARAMAPRVPDLECHRCGSKTAAAGPLWTGRIFDEAFAGAMRKRAGLMGSIGRAARNCIEKAADEAAVDAGLFYTVDEIASHTGTSPPRMARVIDGLRGRGFGAAPTSFAPTGFRTDAPLDVIMDTFR